MVKDPAVWVRDLLSSRWDQAVESLRADGETTPKPVPKPRIVASSDPDAAGYRLNHGSIIKVFRAGADRTGATSWGYTDQDKDADWVARCEVDGPNAREQAHAIDQTVQRVFELYRIDPQADWDLIQAWQTTTIEDYPRSQVFAVQFHLSRRGRVLKTAVHTPNP